MRQHLVAAGFKDRDEHQREDEEHRRHIHRNAVAMISGVTRR